MNTFLSAAIDMAKEAGRIQLSYFRSANLGMETKLNVYDVVTDADKASERLIMDAIKRLFPTHGIIAEESGEYNPDSDYKWIIDPLDGTTNFSQGLPVFSVSIALEHLGSPVVGVVYAPYLDELFHAVKGEGAFMNGHRISCSRKDDISMAVVATGIPYDKKSNPDNNLREISVVAPEVRGLRRLGSAAVDLCYVAAGFFDAYWELNLKHWDVAAGSLIASEAGAEIIPIRANRYHSILAVIPSLKKDMLSLLKPVL